MSNSLKIKYQASQSNRKSMNLLSKLVIFSLFVVIGTVIFLFLKMTNLNENHISLDSKIENVRNDFNDKIENVKSEFNDKYSSISQPSTQIRETAEEMHYGIDVSHWNGDVISEISGEYDISFVICKATQGKSYIDPEFKNNWQRIKRINKIRGAYHFYMYNDDPTSQAKHFCDVVSDLEKTDMSLILDVEELSVPKGAIDKSKFKEDLLTFLDFVEERIKRVPILYTDYSFANQYLDDSRFSKYPLWLAEYTKTEKPKIPNTWKEKGFFIWQRNNSFSIHSSKVDYDVFYGEKEGLIR
jgi:lysozyme